MSNSSYDITDVLLHCAICAIAEAPGNQGSESAKVLRALLKKHLSIVFHGEASVDRFLSVLCPSVVVLSDVQQSAADSAFSAVVDSTSHDIVANTDQEFRMRVHRELKKVLAFMTTETAETNLWADFLLNVAFSANGEWESMSVDGKSKSEFPSKVHHHFAFLLILFLFLFLLLLLFLR
eukprot:TRINITY_DN1987_c1_g1_i5.p1 TRINITY_DN1987_c1_g1~~TRINITY_DN1987_c1_g1_i5.p1  ORF type:complete len:191 (+),score=31.07 TRINITY_DN1987_c1_g1_i5:38-574(+)